MTTRTNNMKAEPNIRNEQRALTCCVSVCRNYKNFASIIDLYAIPKESYRRKLWCEAFAIPEEVADLPSSRVCALHFRSKMGLPPLRVGAPPKPPPVSSAQTSSNPTSSSDDCHHIDVSTTSIAPVLNIPIQEELDFSTVPESFLETVLSEELSVPSELTLEHKVSNNAANELLTGPNIPVLLDSEFSIANSNITDLFETPIPVKLVKCGDEDLEDKIVDSSNVLLALECEEEPLSNIQQNIYMKDVMDFLSANEIVYRLAQASFPTKFPTDEKTDNELGDKIQKSSTINYLSDNSNLQILGNNVSLPTLQTPLNNLSTNVPSNLIVFPPNVTVENNINLSPSLSISNSPSVPVNFSSSVTDVSRNISFIQDGNGQILNQNFCSNLSVDGSNVLFSKSLTLSTSNTKPVLAPKMPPQIFSLQPPKILSGSSLPVLQKVTSSSDNLRFSSNKPVTLNAVPIFQNKIGSDNGAAILSPSAVVPQFRLLTPLSTVQRFQNVNTQSVNVSSSLQSKTTGLLPSIVSHVVNTPSTTVNQTVQKIGPPSSSATTITMNKNSPEFIRLMNASGAFVPITSLNSSKEDAKSIPVISQVGLNSVGSATYQLLKLSETARNSPSFSGNSASASNVIPVALQRIEPNHKHRPRQSVIDPHYLEEIFPPAIKGIDPNDPHSADSPKLYNAPPPVAPMVEFKSGEDITGDAVPEDNDSNVPVIVNVISAKEGASEFFADDKMPEILFDKSKQNSVESYRLDSSYKTDNTPNSEPERRRKIAITTKESDSQFCCFKSSYGEILVSKLHSVFALQREISILPSGTELVYNIYNVFNTKCGSLKNRLDDADNLRKRLKEEKFVSVSAVWMLLKKYFPRIPPCTICGNTVFKLDTNEKFRDGFCYTCSNLSCRSEIPIQRPAFFERFKNFSLEHILLLTYHWACMSSLQEIMIDIDLEVVDIWRYFKAIQQLCRDVNVKKGILGVCPNSYVEAAVVCMGEFFVLGAYDRKSANTRLEVLSEEEALESMTTIKLLTKWLYSNSTLVCERKIPYGVIPGIKTESADGEITDPQSPFPHTLNIRSYLHKSLATMFERLNHHKMSKEFIGGFLSERQWRDKFGRSVELAFWTIMAQIRDLNTGEVPAKKSASVVPGNISHKKNINPKNMEACELRWGPFTSIVKMVPDPLLQMTPGLSRGPRRAPPIQPYRPPKVKTVTKKLPPTDFDVASYFQDVPEIPGANLYLTSKSMLAIKIRFDESDHDANAYNVDAIGLGLRLRKEGFISSPVRWLVKKGYIRSSSTCYLCSATAFLRDNPKFSDGCSWSCQNKMCQFENVFKRPKFYARFHQQPMAHISAMIFHWTVQSDTAIITSDAPMDIVKISHAWRAFQLLCSSALKRDKSKIGGEKRVVEVALVQYSTKYVLGAMDRSSKLSFLRAFNSHMFTLEILRSTLLNWIHPGSIVVINAVESLRIPPEFQLEFADINISDKSNPVYHVLNITSYLLNHVSYMFGHLRADIVRAEAMQVFLDELMWRERHGRKPHLAFAKIMLEIFYNEFSDKSIDLIEDEKDISQEIAQYKLKEARVVLRRIPKTVLKYYNCLPPNYSERNSSSLSSGSFPLTHPVYSEETCATLENIAPSASDRLTKSCQGNMTPTRIRKCRDEDEYVCVDEDESDDSDTESADEVVEDLQDDKAWTSSSRGNTYSVWGQGAPKTSRRPRRRARAWFPKKPSNVEVSTSHSMNSNQVLNNSVQPLVINVCRKNKKMKFFIKSDSSPANTSNENSVDSLLSTEVMEEHEIKTEIDPMELTENSSSSLSTDPPVVEKTELENVESSRIKLKRRLDTKQECVECGESVSSDHFMKTFYCTDCKNLVYSTCCSKAFFEHRSSLLFGKRMPRRYKEHKGLHKSMRLSQPWHCNCGFSTVNGNQLASHMVKCEEETCYRSSQ